MNLAQVLAADGSGRIDLDRVLAQDRSPGWAMPILAATAPVLTVADLPPPGTLLRGVYDYLLRHPGGTSKLTARKALGHGQNTYARLYDLERKGLAKVIGESPHARWVAVEVGG